MLELLLLVELQDTCRVLREFSLRSPSGHEIAAVLEAPPTESRLPTIVLVSGAGPSTRHHFTIPDNGAWDTIADHLVRAGYAVVRFDEVGTGRSTGDYNATATTVSLANDVTALVAELRRRSDVAADRIVLLGWSEGAAIAGLVASRDQRVAGLVLLAPPTWNGRRIMDYQNDWQASHDSSLQRLAPQLRVARIREREAERMHEGAWFRSFLTYEPLPPFRAVKAPVLALHGTNDHSVTIEQSRELVSVLRKNGNPDVTLFELQGVTHYFTEPGKLEDMPPFKREVLSLTVDWLRKRLPAPLGACKAP